MAFIPADNVAQVEMRYLLNDQRVENTLYFNASDEVTVAGMEDLAAHMITWYQAYLKPLQAAACIFQEAYITDLTTSTSPTVADTSASGTAGTGSATAAQPGNVTMCISFRTNARGRSARGRNYVVGLNEGACVGNEVTPTIKAAYIEAYEALRIAPPTDWTWVVISRYSEGAPRVNALVRAVTSVVVVDDNLDSQRRRLTGRGT